MPSKYCLLSVPGALLLALAPSLASADNAASMESLAKRGAAIVYIGVCGDLKRQKEAPGPRDAEDLKTVTSGAAAGISDCDLLLGRWYEYGQGVSQSFAEAKRLYTDAAASDGHGYVALGKMAELGHGQDVDYAAALKDYTEATQQKRPAGESDLARLYERGLGTPADAAMAVTWYRKAAYHFDDAGWEGLDRLQSKQLLSTPEQVANDRNTWNRAFISRVQDKLDSAARQEPLQSGGSASLLFRYVRGSLVPAITVQTSSGKDDFDRALVKLLSTVELPPPPIFNRPDGTYTLDFPVQLEPPPASAASASQAMPAK